MHKNKKSLMLALGGLSILALALPAIGQEAPESLIPEGFETPPAKTPPPKQTPPPASTPETTAPSASPPAAGSSRASGGSRSSAGGSSSSTGDGEEGDALEDEIPIRYDVPPAARRSMRKIGIITEKSGGFPATAFGETDGKILLDIISKTNGPLASRWGTIVTRRLLASLTDTPGGIKPQDWVAERTRLLVRMGESVAARKLIQQVDAGNFNARLYMAAMPVFLANADLAGMCPHADRASIVLKNEPTWKMARPICASLAAEQANATALLRQNRRQKTMVGVDYLLTEKAVGAGTNGRRSVKIEWEKASGFNAWRHGLAHATGVEPPQRYYDESGRHLSGWNVQLPMLPLGSRIRVSYQAAALGVLSDDVMADIFAQARDDEDVSEQDRERAELLSSAFGAESPGGRVAAMESLWDSASGDVQQHAVLVLTARAAAAVPANPDLSSAADQLIRSMFTAGYDRSAAAWADIVSEGSVGWGMLAVGAPGMDGKISYGQLDSFYDDDDSSGYIKSKMLLAGLAGLDRVDAEAVEDSVDRLEFDMRKESGWTRAIAAAAGRGESGTVALLAAAAMQADSWSEIPPRYLYHIVRALRETGREAEARMIAAEAISFS